MAGNKKFSELSLSLKQDIAHIDREIPHLQYLSDQLVRATSGARHETSHEIRKIQTIVQELCRKSLLNTFQLQLSCGNNSDWKLQCKNLKRNLDRSIERFCNLNNDVESNLSKYCVKTYTDDDIVELRKKSGTFSSIQQEVDTATELMREGVDHVLTRNSVMYTHTDYSDQTSERFDTTNLQRCYRTLVAKKRSLMETDDRDLTEKQRETKNKLVRDISELTRMYDDLQELVSEQVTEFDEISRSDARSTLGLTRAKKKCSIM